MEGLVKMIVLVPVLKSLKFQTFFNTADSKGSVKYSVTDIETAFFLPDVVQFTSCPLSLKPHPKL